MEAAARLDYLLTEARRADPDRYLGALFAPAERREPLLALVLLNRELARVPEVASQPMLGLIRYQWWRDAIGEAAAGRPRDQPVVEGLAAGLGQGWFAADALRALVDAREPDLDGSPPDDPGAVAARMEVTEGASQELAYRCLGGRDPEEGKAARLVGTALGLVAAARARLVDGSAAPLLTRAVELVAEARRRAAQPKRENLAAFLPGRLAAADARRLLRAGAGGAASEAGGAGNPRQRSPLALVDLGLAALRRRY